MSKHYFICGLLLLALAGIHPSVSMGESPAPTSAKYRLTRQGVAGLESPGWVFIIVTPEGYPWVATSAKLHWLIEQAVPAKATLEWAPGCKRIGGEPLDTAEEQEALKAFCLQRGIKLVTIPDTAEEVVKREAAKPVAKLADDPPAAFTLPEFSAVFTVACQPHSAALPRYFDDTSLLALYPHLKPSRVTMAVGGKRVWQSGVIVTKDKKCLFWKTCSNLFIAIDTADNTFYFAKEPEVRIE